jgi:hypothetical protein
MFEPGRYFVTVLEHAPEVVAGCELPAKHTVWIGCEAAPGDLIMAVHCAGKWVRDNEAATALVAAFAADESLDGALRYAAEERYVDLGAVLTRLAAAGAVAEWAVRAMVEELAKEAEGEIRD